MSEWQPIETAPKDQKVLCLWNVPVGPLCGPVYSVAQQIADNVWWSASATDSVGQNVRTITEKPTHWMPLSCSTCASDRSPKGGDRASGLRRRRGRGPRSGGAQ